MNDNLQAAVNEANMSSLTFEILDYSDRIMEIFSKIDTRMDNLSRYYQGDSYNELANYYNDLKNNYDAITSNIINYSNDLVTLVRKLKETDVKIAFLFESYSADTKNQIKSNEDGR